MTSEYTALLQLKASPGWDILQALWIKEHEKIVDAMRRAGKRGNETSWRYFAGQQEGFDLAIMQLHRALAEMESKEEDVHESVEAKQQIDELMKTLKGEPK